MDRIERIKVLFADLLKTLERTRVAAIRPLVGRRALPKFVRVDRSASPEVLGGGALGFGSGFDGRGVGVVMRHMAVVDARQSTSFRKFKGSRAYY
jgi:hypothetical protein